MWLYVDTVLIAVYKHQPHDYLVELWVQLWASTVPRYLDKSGLFLGTQSWYSHDDTGFSGKTEIVLGPS